LMDVMAHAQKPDFVFRRNGRVHLNRQGHQFIRLLCASVVVMLDIPCSEVVWRVLVTHSIRQFPLHFPSLRHRVPSHFNWTLHPRGLAIHVHCSRWFDPVAEQRRTTPNPPHPPRCQRNGIAACLNLFSDSSVVSACWNDCFPVLGYWATIGGPQTEDCHSPGTCTPLSAVSHIPT
jgi:hypothetical protein